MSEKRVLITGAAGFLGSHLCEHFLNKNDIVIGLDNLSTGQIQNVDHLKKLWPQKFYFQKIDVCTDWTCVTDLIQQHQLPRPKFIFHFASAASVPHYQKLNLETMAVNSLGLQKCLEFSNLYNARTIFASTSEVYGDPLVHPQTEDYWGNVNPVGPRGVYDEAKRFQEAMTMAYHTYHGLETRIVRIFNTYGPRMRLNDGRVLPAFIGQALRGEDLTVFGDGSQTRSFCYVADLVEGIYKLLLSDYHLPVNIGNPSEITIKEFGLEILKLTGANQKLISLPLPADDPKQRKPDITKAKAILGWEPKVNRAEGLKITYEYFKSLPKEELFKTEHRQFS